MCIRDSTRTPATRRLRWLHSETLRPVSVQVQAQIAPQRSRNFGLIDTALAAFPVVWAAASTPHTVFPTTSYQELGLQPDRGPRPAELREGPPPAAVAGHQGRSERAAPPPAFHNLDGGIWPGPIPPSSSTVTQPLPRTRHEPPQPSRSRHRGAAQLPAGATDADWHDAVTALIEADAYWALFPEEVVS